MRALERGRRCLCPVRAVEDLVAAMKYKTGSGLPDAIERREILDGERKAPCDLDELGAAYEAQGWLSDAKDCFERTGNAERLEALKAAAIEGDPFLLGRLALLLEVSPDDWRRAGDAAFDAGRFRSALVAFERAGDEARAAEARERVDAFSAEVRRPEHGRWTPALSLDGAADEDEV